jgi:hypothetical protein
MLIDSNLTNLAYTGGTIGAKDESEYFRNPVVKHAAVAGILKILAFRAGCKLVAPAALSYLTPGRLVIFPASRTSIAQIRPASSAVQSAAGNQIRVGDNVFHGFFLAQTYSSLPS